MSLAESPQTSLPSQAAASEPSPIAIQGLCHSFGQGALRKQILTDIELEVHSGEIVVVQGPSGSGKTTLLTLIGALRSVQEGSMRLLGRELLGADDATMRATRAQIGYIFQQHNLIEALTACQNVQMSLFLHPHGSRRGVRERAVEMLGKVGLADHVDYPTGQLSGGQRQRVAVARALGANPRMVLADEPTASLDRSSGRQVVELMRDLAKEMGTTVLLVTHDNRILDVADRIVHLEDGRLSSFTQSVIANTRRMMSVLAQTQRKGELTRRLRDMPLAEFTRLLEDVTSESRELLQATERSRDEAFQSMLDQALEAFTYKLGEILDAERAAVFLLDQRSGELWLRVAREGEEAHAAHVAVEAAGHKAPPVAGALEDLGAVQIAAEVLKTGEMLNIDDPYSHPLFNASLDEITGFSTRSILLCPLRDRNERIFAVAQLMNRKDRKPFDRRDEEQFEEFTRSIGVILEGWWLMSQQPGNTDGEST